MFHMTAVNDGQVTGEKVSYTLHFLIYINMHAMFKAEVSIKSRKSTHQTFTCSE